MVRANGQRDGVGRTSLRAGASEHAQAIVDPTRVSPYRPAGRNIPAIHEAGHTTAPDRMHRTIRRRPQPRAQPTAAVNPLRGSSAPLRPLRGDRRGRPCGKLLSASRKAGRSSTEARTGFGSRSVVAAHRRSRTRGTRSRRKACNRGGVHTRLQGKAQVFPLDPNDTIRTRLTHSLEVSSVARGLARSAAEWLQHNGHIENGMARSIEAIAATCGPRPRPRQPAFRPRRRARDSFLVRTRTPAADSSRPSFLSDRSSARTSCGSKETRSH